MSLTETRVACQNTEDLIATLLPLSVYDDSPACAKKTTTYDTPRFRLDQINTEFGTSDYPFTPFTPHQAD